MKPGTTHNPPTADVVPIAELAEGAVTIEGVVRSSGAEPLVAPISKRACICYEVHSGLVGGGAEEDAQPFYLEDDSGRVLVEMDSYALELGAIVRQKQMAVLDADINAVAQRLADLKTKARDIADHEDKRSAFAHVRQLKEVATLLCCIRAHARGNVHHGGDLAGQEKYIAAMSQKFSQHGDTTEMPTQFLGQQDTVLLDGHAARVSGRAIGKSAGAGYRDGARQLVIVAPEDGTIVVSGEGAADAARELQKQRDPLGRAVAEKAATHAGTQDGSSYHAWIFAAVAAASALYYLAC